MEEWKYKKEPSRGKPPISCWFCENKLPPERILREGVVLAGKAEPRGARRLLICPDCLKENLCEETIKGRWFASPNVTVGILDILFSQFPGAATEEVLQAISWLRENEEIRRLFFLRDGDRRYEKKRSSFLRKLWPWGSPRPPLAEEKVSPGSSRPEHTRQSGKGTGEQRISPKRPRVVTPYEVLGLAPGASGEDIRRAFHRLAVQYHPDKVHHMGEDFQAVAHFKFQELMRAYEALVRQAAHDKEL